MARITSTPLYTDSSFQNYYKLEDLSDSKGSKTLTNTNSVSFSSALFSNGADFGSSNTNKLLSNASFTFGNNAAVSVSLWIKLSSEIASGTYCPLIIGETTSGKYMQILYEYNGGTRRLNLDNSGISGTYNVTLGTSNWHHLAITRDQTTKGGQLYLDGIKVITNITQGVSVSGGDRIFLGVDNSATFYYSGLIDEVGVWTKKLTDAEVAQLYQPESGGIIFFI